MRRGSQPPAAPFADVAELPDGPLGQLLSTLTIAELRMLPLVSRAWFLDGTRTVLLFLPWPRSCER